MPRKISKSRYEFEKLWIYVTKIYLKVVFALSNR